MDTFAAGLSEHLIEIIEEIVQESNRELLAEHAALKPLLSMQDVARTFKVSVRTVESLVAQGQLRPLWVKGQRRFHPDAIQAYLRGCERHSTRGPRRGRRPGRQRSSRR